MLWDVLGICHDMEVVRGFLGGGASLVNGEQDGMKRRVKYGGVLTEDISYSKLFV